LVKRENRKKRVSEFADVNFTVPFALLNVYDEEAEKRGYTRSEALRQGMRRQIEGWTGRPA
jgi:hypothetical protein